MPWEIDPHHTFVEFSIKHLMINTVKGRFTGVQGTFHLDPHHPENSWVKAQIKADSVYTGVPQRDAHLRSADFFDVLKYPLIQFESTEVRAIGPHTLQVSGNFSLHGITQLISLQARFVGVSRDLFTDAHRAGMIATTSIDRRSFGMTYNQNKAEVLLIGYDVSIEINVEAVFMS